MRDWSLGPLAAGVAAMAFAATLAVASLSPRVGWAKQPSAEASGSAVSRVGPEGQPWGEWREQLHWLPVAKAHGGVRLIQARLCRPKSEGLASLAVINHGSPADAAQRPGMRPPPCEAEAVRWFLARGHAVLLPLRRGYGASGGEWAEAYGRCASPDYASAGRESARDIAAAVDYGVGLPGIRAHGVVVLGQSAGGWGTVALSELNHPRIAALISMAGGRGGWRGNVPNSNCRPDRLTEDAGRLGLRARAVPMLWIYAANDSFFGPGLAMAMHRAYLGAGGAAEMRLLPPFGADGHWLFFGRGGSAVWGPIVEAYLIERGAMAGPRAAAR